MKRSFVYFTLAAAVATAISLGVVFQYHSSEAPDYSVGQLWLALGTVFLVCVALLAASYEMLLRSRR